MAEDEIEDEVILDLDIAYHIFNTARQELVDQAHSENLARSHHLESAVACFEDIKTLLRAEEIIREVLDIREEVTNALDGQEAELDARLDHGSYDGGGDEEEAEA